MKEYRFACLLRGINVGGNNIIKMTDLKACFESMGFHNVATFIQSGNVLFSSAEKNEAKLTATIEKRLSKQFNYKACVVIVSEKQLQSIAKEAPKGFGLQPLVYRYNVIFLKKPLTATQAMREISVKEGVDAVALGKGVLYFSNLIAKATQSKLSKIIQSSIYKDITIRNWNSTTKLAGLISQT